MNLDLPENSLLWHLCQIPDVRRREGRIYPLGNLLGILVLAALNGKRNLRQMWLWATSHWGGISRPLGFSGQAQAPVYGTLWYALQGLDYLALEQEIERWSATLHPAESEGFSLDGKVLRGSRRTDPPQAALEVVTLAAQTLKQVAGQRLAAEQDAGEAAIELLKAVPVRGRLVTVDAGLLHAALANTIVEQGGDYLGPLKDNEPNMKEAVDIWIDAQLFPPGQSPPRRLLQRGE